MDAHHHELSLNQVAELGEQIAEHASHLDAATHRLLADLRTFDRAGGWYTQGARSCAEWLSWRLSWDGNTAREHVRVAKRLGNLPLIDEALRRGELSYCKVRAMTRVATSENEALLLEDARYSTGTQLESICRKYAAVRRLQRPTPAEVDERRTISKRDLDDGMVRIDLRLHPDEAVIVWEALTRIAREAEGDRHCRVDALVELAQNVVRGDRPDRSPMESVVTVGAEVLDGSSADVAQVASTADGTCLSVEAARRIACDAGIVKIREDQQGSSLSIGRKTRSIPGSIKRALLKRDRTCRFPGCCNRLYVEGHHIQHWANGGETSLENLVSLCGYHHRFLHELGFRVEHDEHQQPRFYDPVGRLIPEVPAQPTSPDPGLPALHRLNRPLGITSTTNAPRWDGDPVNYDHVIEDLCRIDGMS